MTEPVAATDFIRDTVTRDNDQQTYGGRVQTRFPPEPNGYLHIGHAKAITVNFGIAQDFGGLCNLRLDDTNPDTEQVEYVDAIVSDIEWLEGGAKGLRAKVEMAHENMRMRDPVMYRSRFSHHHNTGDEWCIYPTYDWAHGQSDAIEGVTHSICTLEFDSHRALYDWYLEHCPLPGDQPKQIEFARLEFTHTVTSKRRLLTLVTSRIVSGWDDPRMPTLQGRRRRGYPAAAIRDFCRDIGTTKTNSRQSIEALEAYVRRELNRTAQRRMAVLNPLTLVLTNWPTDET